MRLYQVLLSIGSAFSFNLCYAPNGFASNDSALFGIPDDVKNELFLVQSAIERFVGSRVYWDDSHELCQKALYGAYIPSYDSMYICVSNHQGDYEELLGTIKHEGWHAVQNKCNSNRAALLDDQIRQHLKPRDKKTLHSYHPNQHRAEAEARVVEQIPTSNWIKGVSVYCQ
jgi:hypothetical protein